MSGLEQFSMVFFIIGLIGFVVALGGMSVVDELRPKWAMPVTLAGMITMGGGFVVALAVALAAAMIGG